MDALTVIAYAASAWVLVAYGLMINGRWNARRLSWANAVGAIPISATEILGRTYPPLVLTAAFGMLGVYGLLRTRPV